MSGTSFEATIDRVVDGDTVRLFLPGREESESVRVLSIDTEETHPGRKPVTPLGQAASARARELIEPGERLRVVLPGSEPLEEGLARHRGNYGRLLCYLELGDGRDFQEVMIREGFSPYFQKYGYAHSGIRHARYVAAEREAQTAGRGVWDQIANNGAVMRDYAALGVWWDLRARIIEGFREIRRRAPEVNLYNTRIDYDRLLEIARAGEETTVFMELRDFRPAGGDHIVFRTGSLAQPYQLFIPDGNAGANADVLKLILTRYRADGESVPRRSYAFVTGPTKMWPDENGRPEIVVTDPAQIADWPDIPLQRVISTVVA